jgi:hypothetical protein
MTFDGATRMKTTVWCAAAVLLFAVNAQAADFASKGGPVPANIDAVAQELRRDPYDMELLISFGTSKGGSAGHLALAIRDPATNDDLVHSANFYADRTREHSQGFYNAELMTAIPKMEYLFKTTSSLGDTAAFGLDFGEVYKRSVIGIRVYGVPATEKQALGAFFKRLNDDYHARAESTEYHNGEITYDYMNLNCAKTVGVGFKFGAGYKDLEIKQASRLNFLTVAAAATANLPTEMAVKLFEQWKTRGYAMDAVLYKNEGSTYVDPHEPEKGAFKDLPNRFPSVLSMDFRTDEDKYEDYDNLFAMYVVHNMGKYVVRVNDRIHLLEIQQNKNPMPYPAAAELAAKNADADSKNFLSRIPVRLRGAVGLGAQSRRPYDFSDDGADWVTPSAGALDAAGEAHRAIGAQTPVRP